MTRNIKPSVSPYDIIDSCSRWSPKSKKNNFDKDYDVLPPLVEKIRTAVQAWREADYPNVSELSRQLLVYWFETQHSNNFRFYFAQREAVESVIFLYEHENIRTASQLLKFDSSGYLDRYSFKENWLRLVLKQATGTGKTKVISLLLAWCYFHKNYVSNSKLSKNILIIAPNTIVLDRLKNDIKIGGSVFNEPIIPPNGYMKRAWRFSPRIHVQDSIREISINGNIFLTNIQRFSLKSEQEKHMHLDYFIGNATNSVPSTSNYGIKSVVLDLDDVVVFNDEAHHIHDKDLAWFRTIENINNSLVQKGCKLELQIDVSATPRDQSGKIFPQTISDYPLVEAIAQNVVKSPIIPSNDSLSRLQEFNSLRFVERWKDFIDLGVEVWKQEYYKHAKLKKKALLFVMVDDTTNCDEVKDYLESYPELKNSTFVIHTKKDGSYYDSSSKHDKATIEELRILANNVDNNDNEIKAIVSVLMLKEGWDVNNVTTVIGLRAFSATSNILPEQALGRGIRKMYNSDHITEELSVIGTPAFIKFVETLNLEGVILERRDMGADIDSLGPLIVEINDDLDIDKLDFEIPLLSSSKTRDLIDIKSLDFDDIVFTPIALRNYSNSESKKIFFRDLINDTVVKEVTFHNNKLDSSLIISFLTDSILNRLKLFGCSHIVYAKLKHFITYRLFGKTVNLDDITVIRNLSETDVRHMIYDFFKRAINRCSITTSNDVCIQSSIKASFYPTFPVQRTNFIFHSNKSIFNLVVCDSELELDFANFLHTAFDVSKFIKNYFALGFKLEYIGHEGGFRNYFPDFIVQLSDGRHYIIETKGVERLDDKFKIERLCKWCEDATRVSKFSFDYLYVKQEIWDKIAPRPSTFREIVSIFNKQ